MRSSFHLGHAPLASVVLLCMLAAAQGPGSLRIEVRVVPAHSPAPITVPVLHRVALGGAYLSWQAGQEPTISPAAAARASRPPAPAVTLRLLPTAQELARDCRPLAIEHSAWRESLRRQNAELCTVTVVPE